MIFAIAAYTVLAALAAGWDIRRRTIPNWLNLVTAVGGLISEFAIGGTTGLGWALAHCGASLVIGMAIFALRMWGGGDAKFYAATSAWFVISELPRLILGISLCGVLLLIGWFVWGRLARPKAKSSAKSELPYGVAIAAGGIITMAMI